jgi:starch synthase
MKLLFAASEIFPYAKTGGLADVAYSLPLALESDLVVSRIMPFYGFMKQEEFCVYDHFTLTCNEEDYFVEILQKNDRDIVTYFVKTDLLSQREHPYGDANGDYPDNALRFGLFCMAIVELALRLGVDLIHLNDWHTALVPLFIKKYDLKVKTLFTIHNLAYQGIFEKEVLELLGIEERYFTMDSLEFYGKVNFLKAGIAFSDTVTTVSHVYAKEILSEEFGCGLAGFLRFHEKKLVGILNGIDYEIFPPLDDLAKKQKTKKVLIKRFSLQKRSQPLFVMISRLVEQKGVELLQVSLEALLKKELNLLLIGEGEKRFSDFFREMATKYENFAFFDGYKESLSKEAYLAADFLLMPSLFEPCGLNQFIAMNSGTVALVHRVGGLAESIHEKEECCGRGISYHQQNSREFLFSVDRALMLYKDKKQMQNIISFNLECDFSFDKSAKEYLKLYKALLCS